MNKIFSKRFFAGGFLVFALGLGKSLKSSSICWKTIFSDIFKNTGHPGSLQISLQLQLMAEVLQESYNISTL